MTMSGPTAVRASSSGGGDGEEAARLAKISSGSLASRSRWRLLRE
jgi:hypothetical protein